MNPASMMKGAKRMHEWPIIHRERCHAREVRFTDEHAMIHLADGRIIGVPLCWFPPIQSATSEQRQNYISYGDTVYWHDVDDGIDLTAMLTGLYIVPVYQRNTRSKPHVPITWLYLEGGARRSDEASGVPFAQDTRNIPQALRIANEHLVFELADGRILCLPNRFSRKLVQASDSQRHNYQLKGLTVCWAQLDERIDLIAMLTGFYDIDAPQAEDTVDRAEATLTYPTQRADSPMD